MAETKFWFVWGGSEFGLPTYRHETQASAQREAERLADQNSGTFYVLEALTATKRPPKVVTIDLELPPVDSDDLKDPFAK